MSILSRPDTSVTFSNAGQFLKRNAYRGYIYASALFLSRFPIGVNIYDRDWDMLVLLDTCRVDALAEVADDYEFLTDVDSISSVGSTSAEWIAHTFTSDRVAEVNNSVYIAANGWAERVIRENVAPEENLGFTAPFTSWNTVDSTEFQLLDNVWRYEPRGIEGEYGHKAGHTPPRYVTDRAIDAARELNPARLIVHYSQPHRPYTSAAIRDERELADFEKDPWEFLKAGGDRNKVWNAYLNDLRYVLDDVSRLLNNVDAPRTIISADHGDAFGEWGVYGHRIGLFHPHVKRVPWVETTAEDTGSYHPRFESQDAPERTVEETLAALGYQ